MCMDNNSNDIKHTRHVSRRVNFVRNFENCKIHNIELCEGGLHLAEIATKNVGETGFNPRMKYIVVRLDNWDKTCTIGVTEDIRVCGTRCSIWLDYI